MSQAATAPEERPASAELSELVFVYGGLRRAGAEAFRMIGAEYLRMGEVAGTLLEVSGTPALVPRRGREKGWVTGELFEVSPDQLKALDATGEAEDETVGNSYKRVRMQVYLPGSPIAQGEAWVWQWAGDDAGRVVRSGDWLDVSRPRPGPWFTVAAAICVIGFFPAFGSIPPSSPVSTSPPLYRELRVLFVQAIPMVACVMAWWGLRRRERYEFLGALVLVVSALLSVLGLIVSAEVVLRLIKWRAYYFR
ncbi:MAG: gamma-glutamylcyclotransferase [Verrucomicrobiaceae bacterium]|nr:MAG: gamma-glutamylcyclotransferase [Verrucomicrobiaceae bacterium]